MPTLSQSSSMKRGSTMTNNDIKECFKILKAAYPQYYSKFGESDVKDVFGVWYTMFKDDAAEVVVLSIKDLIETSVGYPPGIGEIKKRMKELISVANGEPSVDELWQKFKKAVQNGYYSAESEYEKLPSILQRYIGNPSELRDLSQTETSIFETVTKGQFYKNIKVTQEREDFNLRLPESTKNLLKSLSASKINEPKQLSPKEENDRRNLILDKLEGI